MKYYKEINMGKIELIIKKMFGKEKIINPIIDPYNYNENRNSFSGGSLDESNVLIVVSSQDIYNSLHNRVSKFGNKVIVETEDNVINRINEIARNSESLIGPFTNIINIIYDMNSTEGNKVYEVYNLLQIESNYLIEVVDKGVISTAFISNVDEECKAVESLLKGLSLVLGEHGVIENGLIANKTVDVKDILEVLSYLNSKYGYILTGEVLRLSEDNFNE